MCSGKELLFLVNVYKMPLKTHVLASHYFVSRPACPGQFREQSICVLEQRRCASASLPLVKSIESATFYIYVFILFGQNFKHEDIS